MGERRAGYAPGGGDGVTTDRKLAQALHTLRSIAADLAALAETDPDPAARRAFAEESRRAREMAGLLAGRLRRVRREEPDYARLPGGGEPVP